MRSFDLQEDIRPVTDLKSQSAELVRRAEEGHPVVLSRHGRAVAVLISVPDFRNLRADAEAGALLRAVQVAEAELAAGRGVPHDEVRAQMLRELDALDGEADAA